jgi:hypothetical protein
MSPEDETPEYDRYEDDESPPIKFEDRDDIDQNAIDMYLMHQFHSQSPVKS